MTPSDDVAISATENPSTWRGPVGRIALTLVPILCLFIVWELTVRLGLMKAALLSPPSVAIPDLIAYFTSGEIFPHLWASLQRGGAGFLIAAVVGVPLGLIIGSLKPVSRALTPIIEFLRQLPPLAMLPVFLLFLGLG